MAKNRAIEEFSNIRITNDGFQVVFVREKLEITKYFAGHTEESMRAAQEYRDKMRKKIPNKRVNDVPRHVLKALGLSGPVVGVFRPAGREHYTVIYMDRKGQKRTRAFSWKKQSETDAYAQAIALRKKALRGRA
ncbi:MAG: hypothetical protein H0X40_06870 [Chthoniobacterales bacterium]|nr:hypothetical protein [Chthoniobacterales bacterium]